MSEPRRAVTFIRVPAFSPERTAAYEEWYDGTHIPLRMGKPGFLGAQRYETVLGRQRYFVIYELAHPAATESEEYLELRKWEAAQPADSFEAPGTSRAGFERGIYDQLDGPSWPSPGLEAPILYVAGFQPSSDTEPELMRWLREEYAAAAHEVAGVSAVRQFAMTDHVFGAGAATTQMHTLYPRLFTAIYLNDASVVDRPEFVDLQRRSRVLENQPAREPYVMIGRLVHTAFARIQGVDTGAD